MREREAALNEQWQQCEKLKEEAVAVACEELSRKLRYEFAIEKEQAIAEALRIAKVISHKLLRYCLFWPI